MKQRPPFRAALVAPRLQNGKRGDLDWAQRIALTDLPGSGLGREGTGKCASGLEAG